MEQIAAKGRPIDRYSYLQSIPGRFRRLCFAILTKYTACVVPLLYAPIVGEGAYKSDYLTAPLELMHSFLRLIIATC
jgi:hypothetical protein